MVEPPNPEKKLAELLRKQLAVQTFKSADLPETLRERVKNCIWQISKKAAVAHTATLSRQTPSC